jgi:hypothetical protein
MGETKIKNRCINLCLARGRHRKEALHENVRNHATFLAT